MRQIKEKVSICSPRKIHNNDIMKVLGPRNKGQRVKTTNIIWERTNRSFGIRVVLYPRNGPEDKELSHKALWGARKSEDHLLLFFTLGLLTHTQQWPDFLDARIH